jgi:hypothetical protein
MRPLWGHACIQFDSIRFSSVRGHGPRAITSTSLSPPHIGGMRMLKQGCLGQDFVQIGFKIGFFTQGTQAQANVFLHNDRKLLTNTARQKTAYQADG